MASSVSQIPKLARKESGERKTPAFPLLIAILVGVSGLLVFAVVRAISLGIFS